MTAPVLNSVGNIAYVHDLKCWAESFDAIAAGRKRAEVRTEGDRKFRVGDMLRLVRTDHEGKPTEPRVLLVIEVLHVERTAGPLEIRGGRVDEAGGAPDPLVVLSLHHKFERHSEQPKPPAVFPAVQKAP